MFGFVCFCLKFSARLSWSYAKPISELGEQTWLVVLSLNPHALATTSIPSQQQ